MAKLINARIDRIYTQKMTDLIGDLSSRSTFIIVTANTTRCPNCVWDNVSQCGSGVYNGTGPTPFTGKTCPTCKNAGNVFSETQQQVNANVKWGKGDSPDQPEAEGYLPINFARIKTLVAYHDQLQAASYFMVDGQRCKLYGNIRNRGLLKYIVSELTVKVDN